MEEAYNMETPIIRALVQQLQLEYDYVIVDTTSTFSALNLAMMDLSTIINFVGIVDFIPTIKNMKRGSDTLKELGYDDSKIRYILNRSNAKTRIDVEDVESILGKHFDYVLPNDSRLPRIPSVPVPPLSSMPATPHWRKSWRALWMAISAPARWKTGEI